jgi:16S rRNA (guanine527-N7)-methyltransferase
MTGVGTEAHRQPLPDDPWLLPPMGEAFDAGIDDGLARLQLGLSVGTRAAIEAHARLLVAWNAQINLTALRRPEQIAHGHVIDSLSVLSVIRERMPTVGRVLDLGSGGGYPGVPVACALGAAHARLLDSVGKKARFLAVVGAAAEEAMRQVDGDAPVFDARAARAEEAATGDDRESWDVVTCRAVGTLAEVSELGLPLVRVGGLVVAWKRDDGSGALELEVEDARPTVREAGGAEALVVGLPDPTLLPGHRLVVVAKARPTPGWLPRPAAERRRALLR